MHKPKLKVIFKSKENYRIVKFSDTIKRAMYAFQVMDEQGKWHSLQPTNDIGYLAGFLVKSGNAIDHKHALTILKG
ncbi:MAG: hypothetical protein QM484_06730 [Woeseiaceae bacterium]